MKKIVATGDVNIYKPALMRIVEARLEAPDVKSFRLEFVDPGDHERFRETFRTGMFGLYGVFGAGESALCVASPQTRTETIECTFRKTGRVTSALYRCDVGDMIGYRGPYGKGFPLEKFEGRNLLFVAGGIGLPPTRSVIWSCLDERARYGKITIIYGARTVDELIYKNELDQWQQREDVELVLTVDPGGQTDDWANKVGLVPTVLEDVGPSADNCVVVMCGPLVMIKFALVSLDRLGFRPGSIYTTLENRMKCGVGKCGRCNIGGLYVCKDGPVFTAAEIAEMPADDL